MGTFRWILLCDFLAQHTLLEQGNHTITFEDIKLLATTPGYYARLQREAIEIFKHPNNFNKKEEIRKINKTWIPVLNKHVDVTHVSYNNNNRQSENGFQG